jgi:hypothetical protein
MERIKKLIALTAAIAMFTSQLHAEEAEKAPEKGTDCCEETCCAYEDSGNAALWSAALPIGAIVVAAIIIATTHRHHHHSKTSVTSSITSHSHSHSSSSSSTCF